MGKGLKRFLQKSSFFWKGSLLWFLLSSFNRLDYNALRMGDSASTIVRCHGEPYAVRQLGDGRVEYQYVERISMNGELVYENHYFLTIADGRLESKSFREETRQPYDQMYRPDPNYPHYP